MDLEAMEFFVRSAVLALGAGVLEKALSDTGAGDRSQTVVCRCGRKMASLGLRPKTLRTILGPVRFAAPCTAARAMDEAARFFCAALPPCAASDLPCLSAKISNILLKAYISRKVFDMGKEASKSKTNQKAAAKGGGGGGDESAGLDRPLTAEALAKLGELATLAPAGDFNPKGVWTQAYRVWMTGDPWANYRGILTLERARAADGKDGTFALKVFQSLIMERMRAVHETSAEIECRDDALATPAA